MSRRTMVAVLALATLTAAAASATRHNRLVRSVPMKDSTVAALPEVRLWFAEEAEVGFSGIAIVGADSAERKLGPVEGTDDPKSIRARLTEKLPAGAYQVRWKTASRDGHVIRGRYGFTVR